MTKINNQNLPIANSLFMLHSFNQPQYWEHTETYEFYNAILDKLGSENCILEEDERNGIQEFTNTLLEATRLANKSITDDELTAEFNEVISNFELFQSYLCNLTLSHNIN